MKLPRRRGHQDRPAPRRTRFESLARLAFVLAVMWVFIAGLDFAPMTRDAILSAAGALAIAAIFTFEAFKLRRTEKLNRLQNEAVFMAASSLRMGVGAMKELALSGDTEELVALLDKTAQLLDLWALSNPDIEVRLDNVTPQG